jgi:hypothetical protein
VEQCGTNVQRKSGSLPAAIQKIKVRTPPTHGSTGPTLILSEYRIRELPSPREVFSAAANASKGYRAFQAEELKEQVLSFQVSKEPGESTSGLGPLTILSSHRFEFSAELAGERGGYQFKGSLEKDALGRTVATLVEDGKTASQLSEPLKSVSLEEAWRAAQPLRPTGASYAISVSDDLSGRPHSVFLFDLEPIEAGLVARQPFVAVSGETGVIAAAQVGQSVLDQIIRLH